MCTSGRWRQVERGITDSLARTVDPLPLLEVGLAEHGPPDTPTKQEVKIRIHCNVGTTP